MDNRELASALWLGALIATAFAHQGTRSSVLGVVRAALHPKLVVPVVALAAWVLLLVRVAARAGAWVPDLIVPTAIWFVASGLVLLFNIDRVWKADDFFRRTATNLVGVAVFIGFFANLFPFSLLGELLLQPVAAFLTLLVLVARSDPSHRSIERMAEVLLAGLGIAIAAFSATQLVRQWSVLDKEPLGLELVLPLWLTVGVLPFIFIVAVWATYESAFLRINHALLDRRGRRRAKIAAVLSLRHHIRDAGRLSYHWARQAGETESMSAARRVMRDFRDAKYREGMR